MTIKSYLIVRIVIAGLICLVVTAAYVLLSKEWEQQRQSGYLLQSVSRQLEAQLMKNAAGFDQPGRFPYLDPLLESGLLTGWCIRFVDPEGRIAQSSCRLDAAPPVPGWFSSAHRIAFGAAHEVARDLIWRGTHYGRVIIVPDGRTAVADVWTALQVLVGANAVTLLAVSILAYIALSVALEPIGSILIGVQRLARGDLASRLPTFKLDELQRMSIGINQLATSLSESQRDRSDLMQRLVTVQEEERRYLARELHDEFGQCVAAVNATALIIHQTASERCEELIPEAERLERTGSHMMEMLRSMLRRIRPIALDELGLLQAIAGLVAEWKRGRFQVALEVVGDLSALPAAVNVAVFRLVQECLTNVAKHAKATLVRVRLERGTVRIAGEDCDGVTTLVEDNGPVTDPERFVLSEGFGVLGMRERVASLGGHLDIDVRPAGGLSVSASIPLPRSHTGAHQS